MLSPSEESISPALPSSDLEPFVGEPKDRTLSATEQGKGPPRGNNGPRGGGVSRRERDSITEGGLEMLREILPWVCEVKSHTVKHIRCLRYHCEVKYTCVCAVCRLEVPGRELLVGAVSLALPDDRVSRGRGGNT
jgi:hypothetical protein